MTAEESEQYVESMRLAYRDLEQEVTKQITAAAADPRKAEQMERLGMGLSHGHASSSNKSKDLNAHSAMSDMFTIEPVVPSPSSSSRSDPFSSSPPSSSSKLDLIDRNYDRGFGNFGSSSTTSSRSSKSKKAPPAAESMDDFWDALETVTAQSKSQQESLIERVAELEQHSSRSTRSSRPALSTPESNSDEAQKKFGAAKAISSSQFFGQDKELDYEDKARLNRFAGASSLSSDQFFGREDSRPGGRGGGNYSAAASNLMAGANLYDMKEGVKEGVTRVAGRLSNLASDLMSSVQEKYGGY